MPTRFASQHPDTFTLRLPIVDLRCTEEVRLDLDVSLALRIADQARFDIPFARPTGHFLDIGLVCRWCILCSSVSSVLQ